MKTYRKIIYLIGLISSVFICSCEDYLEKTQKADVSEKDIFTNFDNFQGYVETMYDDIVDPIHKQASFAEFNNGDDILSTHGPGTTWVRGDYFTIIGNNNSQYYNTGATRTSGSWNGTSAIRNQAIWQNSWYGIRAANITLAHLKDLVDATVEQRDFIEGQAYFFRGYFHWELIKAWGSIPYVDTVYTADSDMSRPQLGLYTLAEKIVSDLQKAADLLPDNWDNTVTGQKTVGINNGRATKGMALANMAECLLYNGSPLFNGVATGNYVYNSDYCKRAADASWKVIELANLGVYGLEPWATYSGMFFRKNNTFPRGKEVIFSPPQRGNSRYFTSSFTFGHIGTDAWYSAPTQNYVELFEMANGLPVEDPASGHNLMKPWINRDPRFYYNILYNGQRQVTSLSDSRAFVQFYMGGRERNSICSLTGFGYRKYWDETLNTFDGGWNQYYYNVPKIRMSEVYLFYAEAVNEAYGGPSGKVPGAILTAVDAVNLIRNRAGMPNVNLKFLGSPEIFRDRIRNERAVELAYENKRWYDLRRWHIHHLPKYRELYELQFDAGYTYFNRVLAKTVEFAEQHYWLPFPVNQITLYPGWKQNPGW